MNSELGAFMLRQLLNSMAIVGPIFLLIGFSYYIFRQNRRSIYIYLSAGVFFSVVGLAFMYQEFSAAAHDRQQAAQPAEK